MILCKYCKKWKGNFMKLKKEFKDFYTEIRIDKESDVLKEKREVLEGDIKDRYPDILKKHGIELKKSDINMFDQGSYKYNTTIKSSIIDRDVAVLIPLDKELNDDPRKIKKYLKESINHVNTRTVNIKEPCVTSSYIDSGEEWLHIDLPLYVESKGKIYLARGREFGDNYCWEDSDPKGLNEDLCGKINGNDQLRRVICYIKKWKNEKYKSSSSDHEVPPSIGLTYLACDCFSAYKIDGEDDDLSALYNTMEGIKNKFVLTYNSDGEVESAVITRNLPVKPYTDVFDKMKESSDSYTLKFYNRICTAVENLTNAINVESDHDAGKYVQKVLGADFEIPAKQVSKSVTHSKKEHSFGL